MNIMGAIDEAAHLLLWELADELKGTGHRPGDLLEAAQKLEEALVSRRDETWRIPAAPWRES